MAGSGFMHKEALLYDYWRSSSSYRVRIALNIAGISYDSVPVDLLEGEQRSADHAKRNPQGLVPVLEIDGRSLTQSLSIIEYLNERNQLGLLPEDRLDRAEARALAHAIAMDIQPVCNLRVAVFATGHGSALKTAEWMRHFITLGFEGLEALLSRRPPSPFCYGDRPGLADICLLPQVYNARRWEVDMNRFPRISAIAEGLAGLAPFAAAHPDLAKPGRSEPGG